MGVGGISVWQLLIILAIVIMLFGTKRLRTLGSDLGSAVKGFRKSMQEEPPAESNETGTDEIKEEITAEASTGADAEKDK